MEDNDLEVLQTTYQKGMKSLGISLLVLGGILGIRVVTFPAPALMFAGVVAGSFLCLALGAFALYRLAWTNYVSAAIGAVLFVLSCQQAAVTGAGALLSAGVWGTLVFLSIYNLRILSKIKGSSPATAPAPGKEDNIKSEVSDRVP